jgi:hypothetical protein
MAPKSRRNRRNISSSPAPEATVNTVSTNNKPVSPARQATVESFITTANFTRDLKWTGIVTLIIAVLIIIAIFVIPH